MEKTRPGGLVASSAEANSQAISVLSKTEPSATRMNEGRTGGESDTHLARGGSRPVPAMETKLEFAIDELIVIGMNGNMYPSEIAALFRRKADELVKDVAELSA